MKPRENTPVETHYLQGIPILVKREDMAVDPPAPPFSKVRGLFAHLEGLKQAGVEVVGYTETSISMAGWGVAWACEELGLQAVLYDPQYKKTPPPLRYHRRQWAKFNPDIHPIPAGRAKVNYYIARKHLCDIYGPSAVMLDLGLPLAETVTQTAAEWRRTIDGMDRHPRVTVVNVGSGTICSGIVRGWRMGDGGIVGVLGRSANIRRKFAFIQQKSGRTLNGLMGAPLLLEDPGWEYTGRSSVRTPFPSHPYYDAKAWEWLEEEVGGLAGPILFWNIGRMRATLPTP